MRTRQLQLAHSPSQDPTNDVCEVVFSAELDVVWEVDEVVT